MISKTELYYFSPTGGTKKVGEHFCKAFAEEVRKFNLGSRKETAKSISTDFVVIAAPVFGGRLPVNVVEKLKYLNGDGKKAVTLVVYGNRAYEDALLELNNIITGKGIQVIASGAFVAQHSMVPEVGKGRPDKKDIAEICKFAQLVLEKIENNEEMVNTVMVPGNEPYKEKMDMPMTPGILVGCNQCKKCQEICPMGAISWKGGSIITDAETCILCMACVSGCPENARILPLSLQKKMAEKLGPLEGVRRENEIFL